MKEKSEEQENLYCEPVMKNSNFITIPRLIIGFTLLLCIPYFFVSLQTIRSSPILKNNQHYLRLFSLLPQADSDSSEKPEKTTFQHVVFGIAASSKLWPHRKNYIKLWWRPNEMQGVVWLDNEVDVESEDELSLPPRKISSDTSDFAYDNPKGHRSAIRLSRIVSDTLRLQRKRFGDNGNEVRWFVMGDDDTVFIGDNLLRVLNKYDHNQFYYIGYSSESHQQNIHFSYDMAYGGGGIAISYPLAVALERMQDGCIERYPALYGSDDRIQACMAELGVPLTKEPGFHQFDIYGSASGLLSAHPIAPLVSLHHLDIIEPIFPNVDRVQAIKRLAVPIKLDSAALMQQSICYDNTRNWTVSVSWGYSVQIYQGLHSARVMARPLQTFLHWYRKSDLGGYSFNTRPVKTDSCQKPFVYYLSNGLFNTNMNVTASEYVGNRESNPSCNIDSADLSKISRVEVYKKPDPLLWDKAPRRNCCRVVPTWKENTIVVDVGVCREDEIVK